MYFRCLIFVNSEYIDDDFCWRTVKGDNNFIEYILWYVPFTPLHFVMVYSDDGLSEEPKHVTSYCKQKGICVPMKLCQLSEKSTLGEMWLWTSLRLELAFFISCMEQ